ncbi:hypothetical protein RHMOL_Rhmol11G0165100 [Rhododendron molle]|uniref:Uncharacterized protein n=1 Tax=Rhododendron molle TaxID=49168 RepID=A0ACC0LTH7_RHOML|nr:hypothetical protein RHMOL_Rhmol11G0165100 [Rhododendron molle]
MESEGTAQSQTSSAKDKQPRRLWTRNEEECLLAAMTECISEKYRAHNGFKPGYFNEVEKELKKKLPGTTLKAVPNIESKVKLWKKMYSLISTSHVLVGSVGTMPLIQFKWIRRKCGKNMRR